MTPAALASRARIGRLALGDVLHRAARRFGTRDALIEGEQRTSFRTLDEDANRMAHALAAAGLVTGDRVAMLCDNSAEMVVAMFGVYKAGGVWVPINTALAPEAVGFILAHSQARHLVADGRLLADAALRARVEAAELAVTVCSPAAVGLPPEWVAFDQRMAGFPRTQPETPIDGDALVQIMYTSGTTGRQKGVMHSHASIHSVLMSNLVEWGMGVEGEVFSCHLPLFHVG